MKRLYLDERNISDTASLHDYISAGLSFPAWYGRNLSALYDCLTDIHEETEIIVKRSAMQSVLAEKYIPFEQLLTRVNAESTSVHIIFILESEK